MAILSRNDLMSLEEYASLREQLRDRFIRYKQQRQFQMDDQIRFYFEDKVTVQYQIQEMLRVEKIFEAEAIQEELDAYNPLVSQPNSWKATMMLEYPDPDERKLKLSQRIGIEDTVWLQVGEGEKVYAIANEDLDRSNQEKTSSVHFLRFELTDDMVVNCLQGAGVEMGIEHPAHSCGPIPLPDLVVASLRQDLNMQGGKPSLRSLVEH